MNISDRTFELFEENQNLINEGEFSKFLKTVYAYTNNLDIVAQALYVLSQTMPDETIHDLIEYSNNKNAASTKSEDYHIELNDGSLEFEVLYEDIIDNTFQSHVKPNKYLHSGSVTIESLLGADMYSIAPNFDKFSPDDLLESSIDALISFKGLSPANLNGIKNEWHIDPNNNNVSDELCKYLAHILAVRILATVLIDQFEIYYKICYERFGFKLKPGMNGNAGCFSIKLDDFYKKMINFHELPFDNGDEALQSLVSDNPRGGSAIHNLYGCLHKLWWIAHEPEFNTYKYIKAIQSIQMSDINNLLERFSGYGCFELTKNEESELRRIRG